MTILLTQQNLADRWQVTKKTIENYRLEGILTPCKDIPVIRFTEQHISELEGVKLEKVSPLQVKKLERELEELKAQNEKLRGVLSNVLTETSKIINF